MIRSLRDAPGYVENAFFVAPSPFHPEDVVLGRYTFLPWARTGIAAFARASGPGLRARVDVKLTVDDGVGSRPVGQTLELYGPGDLLELNTDQIIRRLPAPGSQAVEGNYLAHIEFDRPDLPWLFSPFLPNGDRLTPWLALVVLRADRVAPGRSRRDGRPPTVWTFLGELQDLSDGWAWAHVQLASLPEDGDIGDRLGPSHASANLSRIVCPRYLGPVGEGDRGREWVACLVPAIDAGRQAALGGPDGSLDSAWVRDPLGGDSDVPIELPVFDSWSFRTGEKGDFESLAGLLVAVPAPYAVGRRVIDASQPQGPGQDPLLAAEGGRRQVIRGPLVSPLTDRPPDTPEDDVTWDAARTAKLGERLDQADVIANRPGEVPAKLRPLVGPEIYARYHLARNRVAADVAAPDATWFGQLNLRPVNRVVAGLGTRVVQRDQEPLMQAAWAQVDKLEATNQWVRAAQLSRFAAVAVHRKLKLLPEGDLLGITRRVQSRISIGQAGETVAARVAVSATPSIAVSPAFRRATRALGPVARFDPSGAAATGLRSLVVQPDGPRDFARAYVELDGIRAVSEATIANLDLQMVASVIGDGVDPVQWLRDQSAILAQPSAADVLTPDAVGAMVLDQGFRLVDIAARDVLAAMPDVAVTGAQMGPELAASHLGLLQGLRSLSGSASPEIMASLDASIATLSSALSSVDSLSEAATRGAEESTARQTRLEQATADHVSAVEGQRSGLTVALARAAEGEARVATVTGAQDLSVRQAVLASAQAFEQAVATESPETVALTFAHSPFVARFARSTIFATVATQVFTPEHAVPVHLLGLMADMAAPMPVFEVMAAPIDPGAAIGGLKEASPVFHHGLIDHAVDVDADAPIADVLGGHAVHVEHPGLVVEQPGAQPAQPTPPLIVLTPAATRLQALMSSATLVSADAFRQAMVGALDGFVSTAWPTTPVRERLGVTAANLLDPIQPQLTITARIDTGIARPRWLPPDWFKDNLVQPIMAAPVFTRAMYEALDGYNRDWLVPGLGKMKEPDLVTALITNARFIESFLIGLSHEMGRELLWRGYPTDQRGTYFRRFFDHGHDEMSVDGQPGFIHRFAPTPLGTHLLPTLDGRIVFLIRGELIRRYPDAVVSVVQQDGQEASGHPKFTTSQAAQLFIAPLQPNIVLAGFDLTKPQVLAAKAAGNPFWLIIAEHPTGPRFGLDFAPSDHAAHDLTRVELDWKDLPVRPEGFLHLDPNAPMVIVDKDANDVDVHVTWGPDAATNARILLQDPVRAAFPVAELLQEMDGGHHG